MKISEAPCWGEFMFTWKNVSIHVPAFLNSYARYKSGDYWDKLVAANPHTIYIKLEMTHVD